MIQCGTGLFFCVADILHPFSASKETSAYIASRGWQSKPVLADHDVFTTAVSSHLQRPFYNLRGGHENTFFRNPPDRSVSRLKPFLEKYSGGDFLILLTYPPPASLPPGIRLEKTFPAGMVPYEKYYLLTVSPAAFPSPDINSRCLLLRPILREPAAPE
ncbi:MAG: hypothetical protein SFY92_08325 [Verrucomicrobiae bacterium]|nr:hypothetical protein [Verrucomicrobiae bacterium]